MPRYFNRPPRIQPELPVDEIEIPAPPASSAATGRLGMVTIILPLITILGYGLVTLARGSGNILFILPMAIAAVATSVVGAFTFRRNQQIEVIKQRNYAQILTDLRKQMQDAHEKQQYFYQYNLPAPDSICHIVNTIDNRLWERRQSDEDFAQLRLGMGMRPSTVTLSLPSGSSMEAPQLIDARRMAEDYALVRDVPLAVSLRQTPAVGITGNNGALVADFARAMLVHYVGLHPPNEARLFIIGREQVQSHWSWARWLPHCNTTQNDQGKGDQLCFARKPSANAETDSSDQVQRFWESIQTILEERKQRLDEDETEGAEAQSFILVVVDMFASGDDSPLEDVDAEATLSLLLNQGHALNAGIVFLVPDFCDIPSECQSVISLELSNNQLLFRYDQTGVNSPHVHGLSDRISVQQAEQMARSLRDVLVRTTYGGDLPFPLHLLDMLEADSLEQLGILERWTQSRLPSDAWPQAPIGVMMGGRVRSLIFSATEDGNHGMIAGTTGSGKSELLTALIISLAINYDPSIVNFVLVDYKGGTAFDIFRKLPHTTDVITNVQGQAGIRMFMALRAEMNRRNDLLRETNTKDIAEYHELGFHQSQQPLPHLFVIIDEFAEMIKAEPEFKAYLESVARLGRNSGVHLILATQRPSGVVSDQILANMKFRICLRVETPDDSRELIGRSDAVFLPSRIPGRAYMQIGRENVEMFQSAFAGGKYQGQQQQQRPPIIWLDKEITEDSFIVPRTEEDKVFTVIINHARNLEQTHEEIQRQPRPWPKPLPERLVLRDINQAVADWLDGEGHWRGIDWTRHPLEAKLGLIDIPTEARRDELTIDLTRGHIAIFGSSGFGKTTFVRSLITTLVSIHSPAELQIYALDFAGGDLDVFRTLPHLGANVLSYERERVLRLIRKLNTEIEQRQLLFRQTQASDLIAYNSQNPEAPLPAILFIIDNIAEFRENYPDEIEGLIGLARDARSYGVHLIVTAEQTSSIPPKLYNQFQERVALHLVDRGEYIGVVGRVPGVDEIPGRGFVQRNRTPLEFQAAQPVGESDEKEVVSETEADENKQLVALSTLMESQWDGARPVPVEILQAHIPLQPILPVEKPRVLQAVIGIDDLDLEPMTIDLVRNGTHFIVTGPPLTGKTTALRTLLLSLAHSYTPHEVAFILVDFQRRFFQYGGQKTFGDLPHTLDLISEKEDFEKLPDRLITELQAVRSGINQRREIIVCIDNYDDINGLLNINRQLASQFSDLARRWDQDGLHFVIGVSSMDIGRFRDDLTNQIRSRRYGLALDSDDAPRQLDVRTRLKPMSDFPPGRGYLVRAGHPELIQVATPQLSNQETEDALDEWIDTIQQRHTGKATWQTSPELENEEQF